MEEGLREELLAKTRQALAADKWETVARLWQPWIELGDAEAKFQLAYHYLWCTPGEDEATCERMKGLLRDAASQDHPDAIWFLASFYAPSQETDPESERLLLKAGQLGSVNAQRQLGVKYATGDWSGPTDLAEAARWYRLAAEQGHAESQYDLGFMLLLGEGGPKNAEEGLMWLERAGELGEYKAFRLLVDCYDNGFCGVPVDPAKAGKWRKRMEEYNRQPVTGAAGLDHVFVCTAAGAPAADLLCEFGLTEGAPNTHPGQGTACRRFFFRNAMLELIWVRDPEEAQSVETRRTRLWDRWSGAGREASPFGIILRPASAARPEIPFPSFWEYRPPLMPGLTLQIAEATELNEPMWCYLDAGRSPSEVEHATGFREVTRLGIISPPLGEDSLTREMAKRQVIAWEPGGEHLLVLEFDHRRKGKEKDFRPDLPLVLRW